VLAVLLVSYAYPVRTWFEQRAERAALEEESERLSADVRRLEAELRLWDDPAYVEAQARDRLGFVMPGEQGYVIVPDDEPEDAAQVGADGLPPAGDGDWYEQLWASLEAADVEAPDVAGSDAGDAGDSR
jgi:cell division protein FtsL